MTIPADISTILVPRFDTLGDIVLLEGFVEGLIQRFPHAQITMLVREGYDQLAPLFPAKLNWLTTSLYPYRGFEENDFINIEALLKQICQDPWDLAFFTTYNRTWIDDVLAANLSQTFRIAIGEVREAEPWVSELLFRLNLQTGVPFEHVVWVDEKDHEIEKYQRLWTVLFPEETLCLPRLTVSEESTAQAGAVLNRLGIAVGSYFACAPAGTQNVAIKNWPAERFAEIVMWVHEHYGFKPLLVGHENERVEITAVEKILEGKGITSYSWLGISGEVPILAALLGKSQFYVGNDTGTMHIAAAVSIPVVGIFGGGTFPRFLPIGTHCLGVAGELPCFGCGWNCIFEDAPCLKLVTVKDVIKAIEIITNDNIVHTNLLHTAIPTDPQVAEFILKAKSKVNNILAKLKISELDRAARLVVINKQEKEFAKQMQFAESDRAERLAVINKQEGEFAKQLQFLESDRAARLDVIINLEKELKKQIYDAELEQVKTLDIIKDLNNDFSTKQASLLDDIETLKEKLTHTEDMLLKLNNTIYEIVNSYSWRITAPLRVFLALLRKLIP